jgi:hypothetical protein
MVYIYALKLEKNKYYIGKTNTPKFRIEDHFTSNGSEWTKMYKPLSILEIKPNCDDYDEDKITRQYMDKYGIDNVRGGSFVSIILNKTTIDILQQMSNGTNNKCFTCGGNGHFSKDCIKHANQLCVQTTTHYKPKQLNNKIEDDIDEYIFDYYDSDDFEEIEYEQPKPKTYVQQHKTTNTGKNKCFRCGRTGHYSPTCYATTNIHGKYL